jgi:DNA-binding response OmpR family regulator
MSPRVFEILARLKSIDLEGAALREELQEILEAEDGSVKQADFSMFKDTTSRLLTEFLCAPYYTLSHEDIRLDVIRNEEASDSAVRSVIKRARKEMKSYPECLYEIKSISKTGYKLERRKTCQNVAKPLKIVQKSARNK